MENLNFLRKKYNDEELYIIGALDCFGVPHTPDNLELKSYIDMVCDELVLNGLNVNYVNLHSIGCNKTYSLNKIINSDYTKKQYYDLNLIQSKKAIAKNGIFPFPLNPRFLTDYYTNPTNPDLKITSHYCDAKNPIFFYSCGQMNFNKYLNMQSNDIKKIAPEILLRFDKNFKRTLNDVKKMIDHLINLNPTVDIYMFGIYPMFYHKSVRVALSPIYIWVNKKIEEFFSEYNNVHFVDVIQNINYVAKDDCHPNYKGQCYMKKQVLDVIKSNNLSK